MREQNNWTLTDFLVAGYLASPDSIGFKKPHHSELFTGKAYFKLRPASSKFFYPKKDLYNQKIKIYVGTLLHDLPSIKFRDDDTASYSERTGKLYNFFKNYLFIIQPSFSIVRPVADSKPRINVNGFSHHIHLIPKIGKDFPLNTISPVPIFNVKNTLPYIKNKSDFYHALTQTHPLGYIDAPWPIFPNAFPNGVIWENAGHCSLYTNINKQGVIPYYSYEQISLHSSYRKYIEKVAYGTDGKPKLNDKVFYDKKWIHHQYIYKNIAFIDKSLLSPQNNTINNILLYNFSRIKNRAQPLKDSSMGGSYAQYVTTSGIGNNLSIQHESDESSTSNSATETISSIDDSSSIDDNDKSSLVSSSFNDNSEVSETSESSISDSNSGSNNENKNNIEEPKKQEQDETNMNSEDSTDINNNQEIGNNKKDIAFIHKLMKNAITQKDNSGKSNPEFFKEEDLINFHTAMLSPGLVVLAGLSGTGKSSLINLYAETLGIPEAQRKFIPVRPFWNDDSDLLGYVDTVHSIYQPADCGLVDTLVEAQENPDKLYLITFDEMNLARVEYYFSQFLSVLERDEDKRYIYLYDHNLQSRLYNSHDYPYRIKIKNNVLFCGTINMDESTHKFTDKVLDRSNIINLQLVNFNSDETVISHTDNVATDIDTLPDVISTNYFDKMKKSRHLDDDTKRDIKSLLWSLHQLLHHANSNLGIGRRILRQIFMYLENMPKMPDGDNYHLSIRTAFDLQLAQRVFTKLRGSKQDIGKLIDLDDDGHVTDKDGTLWNKLSVSPLSDFKYSKQVLERKGGELDNYGFTL